MNNAKRPLILFDPYPRSVAQIFDDATIVLPQLYIEPLHLEKGWRAGFGLFIHDKDEGEKSDPTRPEKGVSISTKKGTTPNFRPDLWPIMVLGE